MRSSISPPAATGLHQKCGRTQFRMSLDKGSAGPSAPGFGLAGYFVFFTGSPWPWPFAKGETAGASFALTCFGFLVSLFPLDICMLRDLRR